MDEVRSEQGFSLRSLELTLFSWMAGQYAEVYRRALEELDEQIARERDRKRYRLKGLESRELQTLFGVSVRFQRRRYYDREQNRMVYLFDEMLKLPPHKQISPALAAWTLAGAVSSSSYRSVATGLAAMYGYRVISHESVRGLTLETGQELERRKAEELENPEGTRQVNLLFVEVDGMMVSVQRERPRRRVEEKLLTVHEGWRRRHPGSQAYELVEKRHFRTQEKEFWEPASRFVYSIYDVGPETVVVINGDRARWIREGVEHFPRAIYQVDRFHLKRELKEILGGKAKVLAELEAARHSDVTGATFMAKLAEAVGQVKDLEKRRKGEALLKDLGEIPEAVVDYRLRLQAMGISTEGLRGLGAAESQVDTFSDRVKGRGRSWSRQGLAAVMELLCWRNTDALQQMMEQVEHLLTRVSVSMETIKEQAVRRAREVVQEGIGELRAGVPIAQAGRTASGGISHLMNRVISGSTK